MAHIFGNNGSFAQTTVQDAWLSGEFGESYARKIFGNDIVDGLPRYVRGERKGKIKGKIIWRKVVKGGWMSGIGVMPPSKTYAHGIWTAPFGDDPVLLYGLDATDPEKSKLGLMSVPEAPVEQAAPAAEPTRKLTDSEKELFITEAAKARAGGNESLALLIEKMLKDNS